MKKIGFLTFFMFSACLVFCAKNKMPEWIIVPSNVYPSDLYLNGTGSGENREMAELEAVKNGNIILVDNSYFECPTGRITGLISELKSASADIA